MKEDSKELWLSVHREMKEYDFRLGKGMTQAYIQDPKVIAFIAARYKFVGKMLAGKGAVLEVGCGDGFGAPMVGQAVQRLYCTDIDEATVADNARRCRHFPNISFQYHDFRAASFEHAVEAAYLVDVIEHIYASEEDAFMANIVAALPAHGVLLMGTPNSTAEQYSSPNSRAGHVNLKDHKGVRGLGERFFHNVFLFSQNDEVVHTGFYPMAHYLWALCVGPKGR